MGFLDSFLNAVESGALEDRLNRVADAIDRTSEQAHGALKKAADKPVELLETAEKKQGAVEKRVQVVRQQVGKNMDVIRKKD